MKAKLLLLVLLTPLFLFSQTQIGADINGEATGDNSGYSISLSSDGIIVAIGAIRNDGNGGDSGHVRVYKNSNGTWTQIGVDINGEAAEDNSGFNISLSSDGSIVAIGAINNDGNGNGSGHVRVYKNNNSIWTQIGGDINGEVWGDYSGYSVSLSSDGSIVAIGAIYNDGTGQNSGHVRVYKNNNGTWIKIGGDINGEAARDYSGCSVSLSLDGSIVAIGADSNDGNGDLSGHVRVYKNNNGIWEQIGTDIDGERWGDKLGHSISLSSDGSIVAIGAIYNDGNGDGSGHVRVYKNISDVWTQIGSDIDGEAATDYLGRSVSLSSDGSIIAIGANGNGGHVRIYKNNNGTWTKIGIDIDGKAAGDEFGWSVSLSSDGSIVAIGAHNNDTIGADSGHVRVYDLSALLSSDEFVLTRFEVYPNPASTHFEIQLQSGLKLQKVTIYNQLGQFIKEDTKSTVDVSKLSKGLYLVEIITNKGKATKKLMVN